MSVLLYMYIIKFCRHDILEGIGKVEVKCLLDALIKDRIITLDDLNEKVTTLDYG